ncbi:PH domain-containing protein, partial [Nocardioides sp.]|uniref:PH domain-containing protein n=1 Tax=Nocardioides sp. TaxID=35761 RepID=UPI002734D9FF
GTLVFLILVAFSAWFALVRSRVVAEDLRLVVVNGYKRREFEWAEVIAVRLPAGAPWAVLDLADGETCAAMGIQGSDGARARRAVRELRGLIDS